MRWGKTINERGWQDWFAWRPVHLATGEWVWLEWVQRAQWFFNSHPDVVPYKHIGPMGFNYVYRHQPQAEMPQ